ncbi:MAG: hypothetical protein RBS89_03660 [Candidatus Delongbacteria bacterium]|jgi:hypothetical protein|nr:hypothetical protein [Candidatus Delongbacteria bacterium]
MKSRIYDAESVKKEIIEKNNSKIAFVIGNGINRYKDFSNSRSWEKLIQSLWNEINKDNILNEDHNGITLTELYNLMAMNVENGDFILKKIRSKIRYWKPGDHHVRIINRIQELNSPVLTTNFDKTFLKKPFVYKKTILNYKNSYHYPWFVCYSENSVKSPLDGFGIWYINGMLEYKKSIKLSLEQYAKNIEYANNLLNKGEKRLFRSNDSINWTGSDTWLQLIFNKSLFIFGLGLDENEIFLRWLLIQRKKFYNKYNINDYEGWYITTKCDMCKNSGKKLFLESVGIEVIEVNDYKDIYEKIWE